MFNGAVLRSLCRGALITAALVGAPPLRADVDTMPCARCHQPEHDAWSTSRHARAFLNANFRVSYDRAPHPWCLTCHAPEAGHPEHGVSCNTCHVRGEVVLSAQPPSSLGQKAHRMEQDPLLGGADACARCHEFTLPERVPFERTGVVTPSAFPAQETVSEWRRSSSGAAGESCQSCHMPGGSHTFPGGHTPEFVRAALAVAFTRDAAGVGVTLTPRGVGHGMPTGDPFRRIRVTLCDEAECQRVRGTITAGRQTEPTANGWTVLADARMPPDVPVTLRIPLPRETPQNLFYRVTYHFNDPVLDQFLAAPDVSYVLARGVVETPRVEKP